MASLQARVPDSGKVNYSINPPKINSAISIDGLADEREWLLADSVRMDYEIQPGDNSSPTQKTTVKMLYNEEFLYFAFYCYDKVPDQIRARLSDRDQIYRDDYIVIVLDPYGDNQNAYEFLVNPLGIQADLMRTGNNEDETFDAVWHSEGRITDFGYIIEAAIPFRILKFTENASNGWGLMLARNYPRETRYIYSWTHFDRDDPCFTCQGGKIKGLTDVKVPFSLELLPYFLGMKNGNLTDPENSNSAYRSQDVKGRAGLGLKVLPSANLTLDAVINPDFSQIESDAQVISVNNTFAIFYPEKRPFFLEGLEVLQTGSNMFYSRMINDPLFAAKLTGKSGKFTYAFLTGYDKNSPVIIPGTDNSSFVNSGMASMTNVIRGRYDYRDESYIGFLISGRNYKSAHNLSGGIDWKSNFAKYYYFSGDFKYSSTKEIIDTVIFNDSRRLGNTGYSAAFDGEEYDGYSMALKFERQSRNHYAMISYKDVNPTFQSQSGFITRNDSRFLEFENDFIFYYDSSFVEKINIFLNSGHDFTHSDIRKDQWIFIGTTATVTGQTSFTVGFPVLNREIFRGRDIRNIKKIHLNLNSSPFKYLDVYFSAVIGRTIYRNDPPELGNGHEMSAGFTLRPIPSLKSSLEYSRASLRNVANNDLFFDGYILRNITYYQLNREFQFRIISEFTSFEKSFSLYPLFSYKLNPFTTFYAGTSYEYKNFGPQSDYHLARDQYFLKIQYLWNNI